MFTTYKLVWQILTSAERRRFALLMAATFVMAVFEVATVGAIMPFLAVVSNPEMLQTNVFLSIFYDLGGFDSLKAGTIALGAAVLVLVMVGMAVRALVTYAQFRFSLMRSYSISARLLHGYLSQDYIWHVSRNSSEMSTGVLSEVDQVVRESVLPSVLFLSSLMIVLMIGALIFVIEPVLALSMTGLLLALYSIMFFFLRGKLAQIGERRVTANRGRFRAVQEIAGGLKELKVLGHEGSSLNSFRGPAQSMAEQQTMSQVIGRLPRFAVEAAVYGGFVVMVLYMMIAEERDVTTMLPLFGLLGMSATRLFPALQVFYQNMSLMKFSAPALERVARNLQEAETRPLPLKAPDPLPIHESVALDHVHFSYPGSDLTTLKNLSLEIPARQTIGLVGGSGAGKTTIVDLLLGLLTPQSGALKVDGKSLSEDQILAWKQNVGYVPQQNFLVDDTVAANIAFGSGNTLDMEAVERAARSAQLHEFVMNELPNGYETPVGESGLRLSGGQRQRIGIARALYRDPQVLIFDEATSALDTVTERAVMQAVDHLFGDKTIIMIAHRLSTVRRCNNIFLLEAGEVEAQGDYDSLMHGNEKFRTMATAQ